MKLFQITEDDLAELERTLPQLFGVLMGQLTPTLRTQFRRCQKIVGDVRWNYGPWTDVETVPFEGLSE